MLPGITGIGVDVTNDFSKLLKNPFTFVSVVFQHQLPYLEIPWTKTRNILKNYKLSVKE